MKKIDASIVTKLAMRKANLTDLYDKELEKRILAVIKEKKKKRLEIQRIINPIDLL